MNHSYSTLPGGEPPAVVGCVVGGCGLPTGYCRVYMVQTAVGSVA